MKHAYFHHTLIAATCCLIASSAFGVTPTPPSTSPYYTDAPNEYVQDATSDGLSNLNMVLCIMNAMSPANMLTSKGVLTGATTEVKYVALVDKNKCDSKARSSSTNSSGASNGSTSTPNFMTALVDVTRGSNATDPMIAKIWMTLTEQGQTNNISVKLTATQDPTSLPPYGQLRLDYAGYSGGLLQFNGFVDTLGGQVSYVETGGNSSNVALAINATTLTSGNGKIHAVPNVNGVPSPVTYTFAYVPGFYARNDGTSSDQCFDRTKAHANRSVWTYGTYDASTGLHVDQIHPGFPLKATGGSSLSGMSGQQLFGFASYWGVNFGGLDPTVISALSDGPVSSSALSNIVDGRTGNTTQYNLNKSSGKLTKWTQNSTTLGAISGIPFSFFAEGCKLANGGTGVGVISSPSGASCTAPFIPDYRNFVMQWNSSLTLTRGGTPITGNFQVIGEQSCGPNGCMAITYSSATTVKQGFMQMAINGWADALGSISIPIPPLDSMTTGGTTYHADADPVNYYTQSNVIPGDPTVTTLYCLSNCPTSASLAAAAASTTSPSYTSPFASPTDTQWGNGSAEVTYTFDSTGLNSSSATVVLTSALSDPTYQGGVNSGRMYASDLATATASGGCPLGVAFCEPSNPSAYYTYQTGLNQWNQNMWLIPVGSNTAVAFDPPVSVPFTVPTGSAYGNWSGKAIQLQFNGFGNLNGIPGNCVDPVSNAQVNCSQSARFVPAFAIPDGSQLTIGASTVLTKALNSELRLAPVLCSTAGLSTSGVTASVPTASPANPALSSDPSYIGTAPVLTSPPAVIDGVIQ